ncbi:MAG: sulfite exporter TauE/SafE family protein [Myxococcota bacterium]
MESLFEALRFTPAEFALVFSTVALGALVQGSIGFGLNLIVVPVVALIQPAALPAAMIIMALPMTAGSALRERSGIDRNGVLWATLGRIPGVILGAWIVSRLAPETLALLIGGFVVLASFLSVISPKVQVRPGSAAAAGFLAGLMGTASSIGGPPVALLYQNAPGPVVRSTLGATFLIGTAMSLFALGWAGQVTTWHWTVGIALFPAIGVGLFASRWLHNWLDAGWLKPCVIGFAALSGLGVLLRAGLG